MALESLIIEQWIFETLTADATLAGLLSPENSPDAYQQGVYHRVAPDIDPISGVRPETPFAVYWLDTARDTERSLDGSRASTEFTYRITVWDSQNGSMSVVRASAIMGRIDELLDNVTSSTSPRFWCRRDSPSQQFNVRTGGGIDSGITATYNFTVGQ